MDLQLIGKFICELRKENGLTQQQLGEKLGVTNKTVSRWETGAYLPPVEILQSMSELLDVSINELLSGTRLTEEAYRQAAEDNLTQAIQASSFTLNERIAFFKGKWLKEHIAIMVFMGACILGAFAASIVLEKFWLESAAMLMLMLAHGWRNNAMMAYVERKAFDGSGMD